jgi:hypothetical protein
MKARSACVRPVARRLAIASALVLFVLPGLAPAADLPAVGADTIMRLDPNNLRGVPIPAKDLKVGCVYEHYSPELGRRVWSYVKSDHTFWNAFGPGTTMEASKFDLNITRTEGLELLQERNSNLAQDLVSQGRRAFLRLNSDGKWQLAATAEFACIFCTETGERWERHGNRYVPVINLQGNHWTWSNGKYVRPY